MRKYDSVIIDCMGKDKVWIAAALLGAAFVTSLPYILPGSNAEESQEQTSRLEEKANRFELLSVSNLNQTNKYQLFKNFEY